MIRSKLDKQTNNFFVYICGGRQSLCHGNPIVIRHAHHSSERSQVMHPTQRLLTQIPMIEKKNLLLRILVAVFTRSTFDPPRMIDCEIVVEILLLVRQRRAIFAKGSCTRRNCDAFLLAVDADVNDAISMCKSSYRIFVLERFWRNWNISQI